MKVGDKITEKELKVLEADNIYGPNRTTEDGVPHAKAGQLIFRKEKSKWECISTSGIIPKKCMSIRFDRNGRAY
jgi:hypothetical protein